MIAADLGSIAAVGRSGVFHTLVGLKKRKAVLLTVPTSGGVVDDDPDPPESGLPADTGPSGASVTGRFGGWAGEAGRGVGMLAGAVDAGDEAAAPVVIGPFGCPAVTGEGAPDLRLVTVGFVTFVRLLGATLRLVAFARLWDVLCRL
jgi:hypothetical protein